MNYIYKLAQSKETDDFGTVHTLYGIEAFKKGEAVPTRTVNGIFCDHTEAEEFILTCNRLGLDIEHLDDVVYDIINK